MLAVVLFAWVSGAPPEHDAFLHAFDVVNPEAFGGHRILALDDLVGPRTVRDIPGLPSPRAVLLVSATPDQCAAEAGFCVDLARAIARLEVERGLFVVVLLGGEDAAARARRTLAHGPHRFPIVTDTHGLGASVLRIERPGSAVLLTVRLELERFHAPPRLDGMPDYVLHLARAFAAAVARGERE